MDLPSLRRNRKWKGAELPACLEAKRRCASGKSSGKTYTKESCPDRSAAVVPRIWAIAAFANTVLPSASIIQSPSACERAASDATGFDHNISAIADWMLYARNPVASPGGADV